MKEKKKKYWVSTRPRENYFAENNEPDSAPNYTQAVILFLCSLGKSCVLLFPASCEHLKEKRLGNPFHTHTEQSCR